MSTEAALIAACTAAPRDTLPRLVYADWLDEQNDPRGEMIRVMEETRRHPVWADEYQRLRPARNRLWKSLDAAWLETMGYQKVYRPLFGTMPENREHRWRLAEEFIDVWHGGLKEGDGYNEARIRSTEDRLRIRLPAALRDWYRLAGKREDVWSNRDRFLEPRAIRFEGRGLVIRAGGTGRQSWHIKRADLRRPDPPVYWGTRNRSVADSTSAFALAVLVSEIRSRWIGCVVDDPTREGLELPVRFQRAELPGRNWHAFAEQVWESSDTLLELDGDGYCFAACRTEAAYQQLVRDFGDQVERFTPSA